MNVARCVLVRCRVEKSLYLTRNTFLSRIEATGDSGRIHLSQETARCLERDGFEDWITPRKETVMAKGKGT